MAKEWTAATAESGASGPFRAAPGRMNYDVAAAAGVGVGAVVVAAAGVAADVDDGEGGVAAAEQRGPRCGCSSVVAVVAGCCRCC